jgi:uncharacterized protein YyaL (SSP411 family)
MMPNRLASARSPYLRQHAENPVDWREWGSDAFEEARRRDVPVLLSVGYATCHWCHVMAHESFEDEATAAYMNQHFVNVKVDREERPDVDRVYMDALTATTGRGGWPMTVFLTPDGRPIYAGTYYPKERMAHHPSFMDVMGAVVDAWGTNREGAELQATRIAEAIARTEGPSQGLPDIAHLDAAIEMLSRTFDRVNGGFGGAPKFPQAPTLEFLLRTIALRPGSAAKSSASEMLVAMLHAMADGGIYDHLMGGIARYSVDAEWIVPHFEKMLYDNAQLARVYLRAWQLTGIERFREVAVDILDYLDLVMADDRGALHSAEDADSEGEEGRFAVWAWDELLGLLGDDIGLAAAIYGFTERGNFEGRNIPHRFSDLDTIGAAENLTTDELLERKAAIDGRLRTARERRIRPGRDDKVVTAWNGLALRAFAEAGAILHESRYATRAGAIARFLTDEASPGGVLVRSWRDSPGHHAFAEDHAALALGLYALFQATGDTEWFDRAEDHVQRLRQDFAAEGGGFHATRADSELIMRPFNVQDNPTPSDNAMAMEALLIHAAYTGDSEAIAEAEGTMSRIAPTALRHPAFGGYGLAVWLTNLAGILEVAIIGDDTEAMEEAVRRVFDPGVVVAVGDGGPSTVPLLRERPTAHASLAYVCRNLTCSAPVDSAEQLVEAIARDNAS